MNLNPFAISGLMLVLTCSFLTLLILIYGKTRLHRLWALFNIAVGVWGLGAFLIGITTVESKALIYWRFANIGIIFIAVFFFHMICTFCEISRRPIIIFAYLQGILFLILDATNLFISRMKFVFNSFYYIQSIGLFYPAFVAIWLSLVLWGHVELYKFLRTAKGVKRSQALYLFFGMFTGFLGGATNFFPPFGLNLYPWGNFTISLYCVIVTYAVLKYRLLDIRVVVTRTIVFIVIYGPILSIPIILSTIFKPGLIYLIGDRWWLVPVLIYTIAITLAPFLYQKLQKKAEGEVLKGERRNHALLTAAAQHMPFVRDREKLCDSIVNMPTEILDAAFASIYLLDREKKLYYFCVTKYGRKRNIKIEPGNLLAKYLINVKKPAILEELKREYDRKHDVFMKEVLNTMNKFNADVVVPFLIEEELIGFLVLGFKKSGEIYSTDDLNVLANLSGQAALAIENAQFLKEREEMQAKLREEQTLKAIGDLAGIVSHEMGNILNKVSQRVQTMMRGSPSDNPEKFKESLESMDGNIASAKSIWSSINEYKEKSLANIISIHPLAEDISRAFNHSKKLMEAWNIKSSMSFINSRITMIGAGTLPDIFKHLVINSVYGMETTGGEITYSAKIMQDKGMIEIVQEDTGSGLAEDIANRKTCGGEFFAEQGKQGGVSFYVAKQIIYDHKGSLELQSNNGKGTRFVIRLPLDFTKA